MKKFVKLGSIFALAGVLTVSATGCSCKLKQDKIDERTDALANTSLLTIGDTQVDFIATYKETYTTENSVTTSTYIVSRDMDTKTYYFTKTTGTGLPGEKISTTTVSQKAYASNGAVYIANTTDPENIPDPYKTNLGETYYVYSTSAELAKEGILEADYSGIVGGAYEIYKNIPFNGCSSNGDRASVYRIDQTFLSSLSCSAEKKLFGKENTFNLSYIVSVQERSNVTIKTNGDNKITYVRSENSVAVIGQAAATRVIEFTVSYEDVK